MANYKKYVSMAVSVIVLPLAKIALVKIMKKLAEKSEHDPYGEENDTIASSSTDYT